MRCTFAAICMCLWSNSVMADDSTRTELSNTVVNAALTAIAHAYVCRTALGLDYYDAVRGGAERAIESVIDDTKVSEKLNSLEEEMKNRPKFTKLKPSKDKCIEVLSNGKNDILIKLDKYQKYKY